MRQNHPLPQAANRAAAANLRRELATLDAMSVGQLAEKYQTLFESPTRSRNKEYLRSKIAWRIQERAEGGLPQRAVDQIARLAPTAPVRWQIAIPRGDRAAEPRETAAPDPRIPPIGTVIRRVHDAVEHQVTVLAKGFEYRGQRYRSLSMIASMITGKSWNGYVFFFGRKRAAASHAGAR